MIDYSYPLCWFQCGEKTVTVSAMDSQMTLGKAVLPYECLSFKCSTKMMSMQDQSGQIRLQADLNRSCWNCTHPRTECCCDDAVQLFGPSGQLIGRIAPHECCCGLNLCVRREYHVSFPSSIPNEIKALLFGVCFFMVSIFIFNIRLVN